MECVACRVDAGDDGRLDRLPVEGGMAAVPEPVLVPVGVCQSCVGDVGRWDAMHHASAPLGAVAHGAPHPFHAMAVLHKPSSRCSPVQDLTQGGLWYLRAVVLLSGL